MANVNGKSIDLKDLIEALNEYEFMAFPQKNNPKKVTTSVLDENGDRYFLSRASMGVDTDGSAKYGWVKGREMRKQK